MNKITNQQIYDTLYAYIGDFDCQVPYQGGLVDGHGNRSFIGQMFSLEQIERMEALVTDSKKYWKTITPIIEGFFEDPTYLWLINALEEGIPTMIDEAADTAPYHQRMDGEIFGCEIALLSDLNLLSSNSRFNVQVRPV